MVMFAVVPMREKWRLRKLTRTISSLEEAREKLGEPDMDSDVIVDRREKGKTAPRTQMFKTFVYEKLSDTAEIRITEKENGGVSITFTGKYIGRPSAKQDRRLESLPRRGVW